MFVVWESTATLEKGFSQTSKITETPWTRCYSFCLLWHLIFRTDSNGTSYSQSQLLSFKDILQNKTPWDSIEKIDIEDKRMEWIERQYNWCNCSKNSLTKFIYIKELLLRYSYRFKILFKIIRFILWKHDSWLILYSFGMTWNIYTISHCTKNWNFQLRISSVNVTKSTVSCGVGYIYWRNP